MGESRDGGRPKNRRSTATRGPEDEPLDEATGALADLIRRLTALGLSGFFSTEGAIRKAVGDTVPQDWVDFLGEQSDRSRQELFDRLATELGRILEGTDIEDLLDRLIRGRSIEIHAKVRIGPRDEDASDSGTRFEIRTHSD